MVTWRRTDDYTDSDIYPAELFSPRNWELRKREAEMGEFWTRFCVFVALLAAAAFISTLGK